MQASGRQRRRRRELAGGISTALTHTFLGLFLAVPCLAAFGVLRTIVDRLTVRGALVAEELLLMIKPAGSQARRRRPRGAAAPAAAPAPAPARRRAARHRAARRRRRRPPRFSAPSPTT